MDLKGKKKKKEKEKEALASQKSKHNRVAYGSATILHGWIEFGANIRLYFRTMLFIPGGWDGQDQLKRQSIVVEQKMKKKKNWPGLGGQCKY